MIPSVLPKNYFEENSVTSGTPSIPTHGTFDLVDVIDCFVEQTEEPDTSEWELAMTYPAGGQGIEELVDGALILAKANNWQPVQVFRIYSVTKSIKKTIKVAAQHISYDMSNVPLKFNTSTGKIEEKGIHDAMGALRSGTIYSDWHKHHFNIHATDWDSVKNTKFEYDNPSSLRAALVDGDKSIKGTFSGDLVFDNFDVTFVEAKGTENNRDQNPTTITYGIDLVDIEQERNITELVNGILPFYKETKDKKTTYVYGRAVIKTGSKQYEAKSASQINPTMKIVPTDLSQFFTSKPTSEKVEEQAIKWCKKEKIGDLEISLKINYAQLSQDIRLYDQVRVLFPALKVDTSAKVVKYKYNVILDRVEEIELGKARSTKYFNLMDASKLIKGLVPPERIGNGSVGAGKIAKGGITNENIDDNVIDYRTLGENAVYGKVIKPGSITGGKGGHIQQYSVEPDCIAGGSMTVAQNTRIFVKYSIKGGASGPIALNTIANDNIKGGTIEVEKMSDTFQYEWNETWAYINQVQ